MGRVVLDASTIVSGLITVASQEMFASLLAEDEIAIPHHCDAEVGSSLRRLLREQRITSDVADAAIAHYLRLPLARHAVSPLFDFAFKLRENFTFADALYVALAQTLRAPLVTRDLRLARAVESHIPQVTLRSL